MIEQHTSGFNISQIAKMLNLSRNTVATRLEQYETTPNSTEKLREYPAELFVKLAFDKPANDDLDQMQPSDRRAYWQAENERLKFETASGQLIPASDVAREMSLLAKAVVQALETLPDILERDAALSPKAVERVQQIIDDVRDSIAFNIEDTD